MKIRVPVIGTIGKSVSIEADAPSRAEVTAAIAAAITASSGNAAPSVTTVIWRFIREIPANIQRLAALTTSGLIARKADGTMVTRSVAVSDTSRLTVTDGDGDGGNPTLDMADISAVAVWGRASNTSGKPAAIQAANNDRLLARTSDQVAFRQLTVGMVPDSELTYAKIQNVSATARILARATAGAGVIEEATLSTVLDFIGSAAQGDILYRGASSWVRLPAGTAGYVLSTGGAGADPSWVAPAAGGGGNVNADTHPLSPNAQDDEFESGSSIDTGKWTAFNTGATTSVSQGSLVLGPDLTGSRKINGYGQAVTGTWEYTCSFSLANWSTNTLVGMFLGASSGTAGNIIIFGVNGANLVVQRLTDATTFSANVLLSTGIIPALGSPASNTVKCYMRITYDGTTLRFYLSNTGIDGSFVQVYSETSAAFLGTPTTINLGGDNQSGSVQSVGVYDWFRKTA